MMVARHEMPGNEENTFRPVGYGMIRTPALVRDQTVKELQIDQIRPSYGTGRFFWTHPGISCLDFGELSRVATIIQSPSGQGPVGTTKESDSTELAEVLSAIVAGVRDEG